MTRSKKIIIIVIAVVLILAVVFLVIKLPGRGSKATPKAQTSGALSGNLNAPAPLPPPPPPPQTPEQKLIEEDKAVGKKISVVFAERFGSYSNQALFANITDLYPLMTASMRVWADNFRAEAAKNQPKTGYAGVTTRALTSSVPEYLQTEGRMRVIVGTQREEVGLDGTRKVYTQELTTHLVRDGGVWKINSIEWGEAR